ncbi:unnamed protein product [Aureobasidium mustum]|uniref:Uncharacterized protein n=1 Tax=Aureobasidium mustum TaxID=2773714 RepID=A0A9N8JRX1_9PEZI|nr:unnamed protein product [Aureobasidium mustum]
MAMSPWFTPRRATGPPRNPAPPCTQELLDQVRRDLALRFRNLQDSMPESKAEKKERAVFLVVAILAVKNKLLADAEKRKDSETV